MATKPGVALSDAIDAYHESMLAEVAEAIAISDAHHGKTALRETQTPTTDWTNDGR